MSIDTIKQPGLAPGSFVHSELEIGEQPSDGGEFQGILSDLQAAVESLRQIAGSESRFAGASENLEDSALMGNELPHAEAGFRFSELSDDLPVDDIETSTQLEFLKGEPGLLEEDGIAVLQSSVDMSLESEQGFEGQEIQLAVAEPSDSESERQSMLEAQGLRPLEMGMPVTDATGQTGRKSVQPQRSGADVSGLSTEGFETDEHILADTQLELATADKHFGKSANAYRENVTNNVSAAAELTDADALGFENVLSNAQGASGQPAAPRLNPLTDISNSIEPLNRPVGNQAWRQDVGERLIWMTDRSVQSAEIRLNPAHLGPLQVRIDMDQDQTNIIFASQHSAVRDALESAIPKLRELFGDLELNLGDVQIAKQSFNQQQENNENRQTSQDDQSQTPRFSLDPNQENNEEEIAKRTSSGAGILNLYV